MVYTTCPVLRLPSHPQIPTANDLSKSLPSCATRLVLARTISPPQSHVLKDWSVFSPPQPQIGELNYCAAELNERDLNASQKGRGTTHARIKATWILPPFASCGYEPTTDDWNKVGFILVPGIILSMSSVLLCVAKLCCSTLDEMINV